MVLRKLLFALLVLTGRALATVTVTVDVSALSGGLDSDAYITVTVNNCASPTVWNTSTVIPATQNFYPQNGIATFNLYDNVTEVACQGNFLSYYTFAMLSNGETTAIGSYELPPGRFNLANLAPIVTPPVSPGIIQGPRGEQGPVGPAGSAVPLTDANLVANTTAIIGTPAGSQTITQSAGTYINVNALEAIGSPAKLAFGQTASVPSGFLSESTGGAFSLDTTAVGNALGTLNLANLNTAGLTIGNTAPSGHTICGNGTHYVDCTLNYQTVQNPSNLPAEPILKFSSAFSATDGGGATNVDIRPTAVIAGTYLNPDSVTVQADGRVTALSSRTISQNLVLNGYSTMPGGLIVEWGQATQFACGTSHCNTAITLPLTFPNTAFSCVVSPASDSPTGGWNMISAMVSSYNTTTLNVGMDTSQTSVHFTNNVPINWVCYGN